MTELLPCPFCGGEAEYGFTMAGEEVYCKKCGAAMPRTTTKQATIAAWNTRHVSDDGWEYDRQSIPATEENMAKFGWVKVVRCGDCKHIRFDNGWCSLNAMPAEYYGFCWLGERKVGA